MKNSSQPPLTMRELQELYERNVNVMGLFRERAGIKHNTSEAILTSYDLQSGSYVAALAKPEHQARVDGYSAAIARVLGGLEFDSLLEAGVGEATTLCHMLAKLPRVPARISGFDIAWSRSAVGRQFAQAFGGPQPELFTGDLFQIPAVDNAFGLVYTSHAIEPNFGREAEALTELYRVSARWLVLFEPSYELGGAETRKHIEEHGYCRNLAGVARELGFEVLEHRLLDFTHTAHNQTGVLVIRKPAPASPAVSAGFGCPTCHSPLSPIRGQFFCPECLRVFPVLEGIPCLLASNGILASKFPEIEALQSPGKESRV
jgi:uncharacterized protein YbaR (Trm112 family)